MRVMSKRLRAWLWGGGSMPYRVHVQVHTCDAELRDSAQAINAARLP